MPDASDNNWIVDVTGRARKRIENLPKNIKAAFDLLEFELRLNGPERRDWPHYGKIAGKGKAVDMRHCHLNKSGPVYVAVWVVIDRADRIMEIRYAGTHENADFRRIN